MAQPLSVLVTDKNGNALTISGSTIYTDVQRRALGILLQQPESVVLTDINGNPLNLGTSTGSVQGINATAYGVTGNGCIRFDGIGYFFALSQAAIAGSVVTYTGVFNTANTGINQTIGNITETAGNIVTLAVAAGSYGAGQSIKLSGLTTGTWLNGQTVTLLAGSTNISLIFTDPTAHGVQASHAETGSALLNLTNYSFSIGGFVNGGNNGTFTVTSNTSTTLVVTNASGVNETHAGTAGSFTIDCPGGQFTTDATVGQIVFATNLPSSGFTSSSTLTILQGTIASITSATQIVGTVAATAVGNSNGKMCLVWGDDESTALTNAWNAAVAAVTTLVLPGVNPQGTGPAVILVQSAQLCTTINPLNTGGDRGGYGVLGGGMNATYIVPTPNFSTASVVNNTCFLYSPDGGNFANFSIFGAGNSQPGAGFSTLIGAQVNCANNAFIHDVAFLFWGASTTNGMQTGLQLVGQVYARNVNVDGFGLTGIKCAAGGGLGSMQLIGCSSWDTGNNNLYVTASANAVYTFGCSFGGGNTGVSVNGGGLWYSFGDEIGLPFGATNGGYTGAALAIGFTTLTNAGNVTGAGKATMIGSSINSSNAPANFIFLNSGTDTLNLQACVCSLVAGATNFITNNGVLTDAGGNVFSPGAGNTAYGGTGTYIRSDSEMGRADSTGLVAAVAATTLYTPLITGLFRVSAYLKITTIGTSPVLGPITITFTDGTDSVAQSVVMSTQTQAGVVGATGNAGNTTTSVLTGDLIINAKTGVAIQYAIALTGTVGAAAYEAHLKCESL